MPIPLSKIVKVLSFSLVEILMYSPPKSFDLAFPEISAYLYFSRASDEFDINSLKNTSLSVYMLLATISNNFLVSALNSFFSECDITGSSTASSITISYTGSSYFSEKALAFI
jgi:hypothetical protein